MIWFILNGKRLAGISIDGLMPGEIRETKRLLAYENNVQQLNDIKLEIE